MSRAAPIHAVGRLVITPRALADYRDMFVLSDRDLTTGPILDCPGGASPFGAQVRARGGSVVSVDPAYSLATVDLMGRVRQDIEYVCAWAATQHGAVRGPDIGSPEMTRRTFELAADLFALDYAHHGGRYVCAALPHLPFPDEHFALTLCSHLIFCYPEYLSFEDHLAGLLELVRVTAGEVRVFPLVDTTSMVYPRLNELRAALAERGLSSEVRSARRGRGRDGDQLLACWRSTERT